MEKKGERESLVGAVRWVFGADRGRSSVEFWLFGDLHHDFGVAAHEHKPKLKVAVGIGISMTITNPAQLVAE